RGGRGTGVSPPPRSKSRRNLSVGVPTPIDSALLHHVDLRRVPVDSLDLAPRVAVDGRPRVELPYLARNEPAEASALARGGGAEPEAHASLGVIEVLARGCPTTAQVSDTTSSSVGTGRGRRNYRCGSAARSDPSGLLDDRNRVAIGVS